VSGNTGPVCDYSSAWLWSCSCHLHAVSMFMCT